MSNKHIIILLTIVLYQFLTPNGVWSGDFELEEGIVFGHADRVELQLDMAHPSSGNGPYPVLIYIFDSDWGIWPSSRAVCHLGMMKAAERGYVAVAIDYRKTNVPSEGEQSKYRFPDQVYDVKCAVRWLKANA